MVDSKLNAYWLSHNNLIESISLNNLISINKYLSNMVFLVIFVITLYFAFVDELSIEDCLFALCEIGDVPRVNMKPDMDFRCSQSLAQSVST
jgi:hypothetical protein